MKIPAKIIAVLWMFVAAPLFAIEGSTAQWSNAVLTAMLPHFSDCARQLNLPIPIPITISQVARFVPPLEPGAFQAGLWLTNGYCFEYFNGAPSFRSRDD